GGYQSYRRLVVERLYETAFPTQIILLDGNTGTAKTDVITRLPALGVQSIDLEGLANHSGSAFGSVGTQPSQKGFETALAAKIAALDPMQPVVIEAESSRIGALTLPPSLLTAMKGADRIEVEASLEARASYLTRAYADLARDIPAGVARLQKLVRFQGHDKVAAWSQLAEAGDHKALAAELMRDHYDPLYRKARVRHAPGTHQIVTAGALDVADIERVSAQVAAAVSKIRSKTQD
ncbi:unnamed protein product, partial [Ectocarpus sp. 12 AP-2014]